MALALVIIGIIFGAFVLMSYLQYGVLPDISTNFYENKHKWVFTLWVWAWAFPVMYIGSELESMLLIISGICFAFVGVSPAFRTKGFPRQVHAIGAISGILTGMLALGIDFNLWLLPIIFVVFYLITLCKQVKNNTYYVELMAFIILYAGLWSLA